MILNDKVYLGDTLLDLGEANGVTLEYSISDPADMAAIFTPGSWTVNLPKSAVNLQAFGFMTEPGSTTDAPHKEHPCMVIRNGVPLFDSGKLTVIDVTDTINVVITWNTNERLTELSGRKLRDLAITKVMRWDPATFEASEDNDFKWVAETGYKQAGADGIMNYNARGFRPAVKASYLLAALLPGLTIGQAYWNRLENVWLMLPTTNGNDTIDAALTYRGYGSYSNYDPVLNVRDVMRNFKEYGTISATYDLLINQSSPSNPFSGLYIPKDGRYRIFGHIRTSSSAGGAELYNGKFRLMINLSYDRDENGALVENYENLYYSEYPINSNNVFDVTVDLQAGDVVTIFNSYQLTNATISGDIAIDLNEVATENTDTGYLLDYPIRENLPDVGCIEFITALFSMVALQAQTSGTAVKVFSIDDVIGATDAIDISPYINDRDSRQLEYSHGLTADNVLSYVDETDAIHFAANTYNKTVNKVVELPFTSGRDMALYRRDEDGRFEFVGEDTAMALARSGTASIRVVNDHISDSTTRTVTVSVFGFGGLDWATLYGTYWQGYKGVFADNQRVVKYNAVIPESFVRTLDFSKPVHDGVNRYLLMKVSEYTYTGACTLMMALLDGVEVAGGPLENVILADVAVPLLFNVNVEALYNPSLVGTGKLIRELTETVGALPAGAEIAVDLGAGEAKKWKPTFHDHPNKAFLDLIDQGLSKTSDVVHNSVICPGPVVAGALNGIAPDDLPVATGSLYGVVKIDDVTIKIDANGKIYAIATGGVSSWNDLTDKPANLTALAALTGAGIVRRNSDGSFVLDTAAYLTAITKAMVEAVLTGIVTSHQHNYLPLSGGTLTNSAYGGQLAIDRTSTGGGAVIMYKNSVDGWIKAMGVDAMERPVFDGSVMWHAANSNLKTVDWNAKDLKCVNTFADGAVVAGATNNVLPDDLPVATDSLYGVVKIDGVTIKIDANGNIYAIATGGVSSWNDLTDKPANLTALAALAGAGIVRRNSDGSFVIDTATYLTAITKAMVENVLTGNITTHSHSYLPLSGGTLTGGLTINNSAGLYQQVDSVYKFYIGYDVNNAMVHLYNFVSDKAVRLYDNGDFKYGTNTIWHAGNDGTGSGLDADLLDGQHGSFYFNRNTLFNANNVDYNAVNYEIGHGVTTQPIHLPNYTGAVNAPFSSYGQMIHFDGNSFFPFRIAFDYSGRMFFQGAGYKPNGPYNYSNGTQWFEFFHSGNSNKKTIDWNAKDLKCVNTIADGAVVAGALNGTLPNDLPVATSSVFGVSKYSGLAIQPTAGDVALRTKHYTTLTNNSWVNKAYTITFETALSSPGSVGANNYYSVFMYALPTAKCLACVVSIIPYATGTTPPWVGQQLIASATKDSTGYWRVFIYNPTASAVDLTNVKLSIIAQMIE